MFENNQWQPPDRPAQDPGQPSGEGFGDGSGKGFGEGFGEGFGNPAGAGSGAFPPAAHTGWTPPPKPGLVPLQPMTLGTILAGSFQVMRRNPQPTFGASLVINGIVALVSLATVGLVVYFAFDRVATASSDGIDDITAGATAITFLSLLVELALSLVAAAILQGIISLEVARATVGEKLRLAGLWALAKGRIGALIGWSLLSGSIVLVLVAAVTGVIILLVATAGTAGIVAGVLIGIAALLGGLVLGAWIGTRLSLVPSVLLLERLRLIPALRRSWSLTTDFFWRTLGIQLLVFVIVATASQIVLFPVSLGVTIVTTITNPNADPDVLGTSFWVSLIVTTIVSSLIGSVTAIITTASTSLIYIDLRMRKEGLDLSLARFVEARQVGDTSVADPYLTPATVDRNGPGEGGPGVGNTPPPMPNDSPWA